MSDTLNVTGLDESERAALARLIVTLADSKRLMGIRYSDWVLGAPSIETGVATSSMAQDEWGHARLLYAMLKELGLDPEPYEYDREGGRYASLAALDEAAADWAVLVAMMTLVDGALSVVLESFAGGSFEPARTRVPKMLAEEKFHSSLGVAWYRRLADTEGEARGLLADATSAMLPSLLAWVGASDEGAQALVAAGVLEPADDRVTAFKDAVRELVTSAGVDVDDVDVGTDWDSDRGRSSGRPNEEAVARARGDLNRGLLVE